MNSIRIPPRLEGLHPTGGCGRHLEVETHGMLAEIPSWAKAMQMLHMQRRPTTGVARRLDLPLLGSAGPG